MAVARAARGGGGAGMNADGTAAADSTLVELDGEEFGEEEEVRRGDPRGEGDGIMEDPSRSGLMSSPPSPVDSCYANRSQCCG